MVEKHKIILKNKNLLVHILKTAAYCYSKSEECTHRIININTVFIINDQIYHWHRWWVWLFCRRWWYWWGWMGAWYFITNFTYNQYIHLCLLSTKQLYVENDFLISHCTVYSPMWAHYMANFLFWNVPYTRHFFFHTLPPHEPYT